MNEKKCNNNENSQIRNLQSNDLQVEKRTLEELLFDLRKEKNWSFINVIQELNNLGIFVDEKIIKKWELGLEYPDTDILYKFSELYYFPVENFIMAKNNSYTKGMNSIHKTFIKWFCYFTGFSLKFSYVLSYVLIYGALVLSFMFFVAKCNEFLALRRSM